MPFSYCSTTRSRLTRLLPTRRTPPSSRRSGGDSVSRERAVLALPAVPLVLVHPRDSAKDGILSVKALAFGMTADLYYNVRAESPQREPNPFVLTGGFIQGVHHDRDHRGRRAASTAHARPAIPFKSPTYPPRTHFDQRPVLEAQLRSVEERLTAGLVRRAHVMGNSPDRPVMERLYFQMLGARDQIADGVRRLPGNGALYDEDRERHVEALAAFERAHRRWESGGR